jgi:cell division inhibitor SepF
MEPMNTVRRGAPTPFNPSRDLVVLNPTSINDANQIVLILRENRAVVLVTAGISKEAQRRLLDFTSGAVYALRATIKKLSDVRWLLVPQGLIIDDEFVEQIKFANLSDGQL